MKDLDRFIIDVCNVEEANSSIAAWVDDIEDEDEMKRWHEIIRIRDMIEDGEMTT